MLIKEMQGNLKLLTELKDFNKRKSEEIAALAYKKQEHMKLQVISKIIIAMWSFHFVLLEACLQNIKGEFADLLF